jgi:hypothetical protein
VQVQQDHVGVILAGELQPCAPCMAARKRIAGVRAAQRDVLAEREDGGAGSWLQATFSADRSRTPWTPALRAQWAQQ